MSLIPSTYAPRYTAIERAQLQPSTKAQYIKAISNMEQAGINPADYNQLAAYAQALPNSSRAFLKSALRLVVQGAMHSLKSSVTPETLANTQAALLRLESMNSAITTTQAEPERLPHWLTQAQVDTILEAAYKTSRRDYIVLALLFVAALRRDELHNLTFDNLATVDNQPVLYVLGKGNKRRPVPIPASLARQLNSWAIECNGGRVARSLNHGKLGDSLSVIGIFNLVRQYGTLIGIDDLDPHDARRTCGRLLYFACNQDIIKVRDFLGHADARTTQKYIGVTIDLSPVPMQDFGD